MKKMMSFLDKAHSVYHSIALLQAQLEEAGYTRLWENKPWELVAGGKYYMLRGGTALMAFRIPAVEAKGFMMSASHSDRSRCHPSCRPE